MTRRHRWTLALVPLVLAPACNAPGGATGGSGSTGEGGTTDGSTAASETVSPPGSEAADASSSEGESESTAGAPVVDCTEVCRNPSSDAAIAICYSCRCKAAMDGWLPGPDELQCSTADDITIYRADSETTPSTLVPVDADPDACANPSLLTWSCATGSRLGQIQHGDVFVKWICRDVYAVNGAPRYTDSGVIAYNARTGATCWWDDVDEVTGEDDFPDLDLMNGDEANLERYLANFYFTEGDGCIECHDNDPFIYTPYLSAVAWPTGPHALGPFALTRSSGGAQPVGVKHLVDAEVGVCTTCHRLSGAGTCSLLAADSLGVRKDPDTYEQAVLDAMTPGSPDWTLATWMPSPLPMIDADQWAELYGVARDRLLSCCEAPGVDGPGCTWRSIDER